MTPWDRMLLAVAATYLAFKALTSRRLAFGRALGYWTLWPGMDARPFAQTGPSTGPGLMAWGLCKMAVGAALLTTRTGIRGLDIVLVFLGIAFGVLTIVAGIAILFTGRYPRGIFDFNVGVIRWIWRVMFYGYWALGTDRYPPFTLADVADYPATVDIVYPERLSRWLWLVKWLLAIPHFILVAIFVGGWGWGWGWGPLPFNDFQGAGFGGLVDVLTLVAGVILLFTTRYPATIFDFIIGLDRWVLRVAAYASLMRDEYPPFRADMGPREPDRTIEP